ncbi:PREDICTED: HEAT repeat-containing protein 3-like [Branchiostoma belcheri]|uniref:HEAT repeat-containing protein 3-like n=1 Tax=Branchiostoma belcheri TaxID=7741 RepID=A0A6P5AL19_BRABE|nr:PREDICTED: HEAT repeat-containing protein 3-like [Branchiostoma belcheri]
MGKSRNKKYKSARARPTGLPSVAEALREGEGAGNGTGEQPALAIVEKLQSASAEERECACTTLAGLVLQEAGLAALLDSRLVRTLGPLLLDPSQAVRERAAGVFRNMTVGGGHDLCDLMVEEDVMTPLVALLKQVTGQLTDSQPIDTQAGARHAGSESADRDPVWRILYQAVHLLWNLCESSSTAVCIFNKENLLPTLLLCLRQRDRNLPLAMAGAQCLQTVTEDNAEVLQQFSADTLKLLEALLMGEGGGNVDSLLLRTTVAGCIFNLKTLLPAGSQSEALQAVVRVLAETLDHDVTMAISGLRGMLGEQQTNNNGTVEQMNGETDGPARPATPEQNQLPAATQAQLDQVMALLSAQQTALEIIANMCLPEDDSDEEWEDMDSSDTSDEVTMCDVTEEGGTPLMTPLCLSAETHTALISHSLPRKVLDRTVLPEGCESLATSPHGQPVLKRLLTVQRRALLCLRNMLAVLDGEGMDEAGLVQVGNHLMGLFSVSSDQEFQEAVTGAIRSLLQRMAAVQVTQPLSREQLCVLCDLGRQSLCPSVRANVVNAAGSMGSVLAKQPDSGEKLKLIGTFLMEVAGKDAVLWVVAEALDAMFDMFGDGPQVDAVAADIGLVAKLRQICPVFKSRVHKERRSLGEHFPVVDNARVNLTRFIKYKDGC